MLKTAAQQNRSARRNKYNILSPFEATINTIIEIKIKIFLERLKLLPL